LIGGPDGSGKSTLSEWAELAGRGILLDPDAIARGMNPLDPRSVAVAAGRVMLNLIEENLNRQESFGVETTLSSNGSLKLLDRALVMGYRVRVIFVALESPERCIIRIRNRVAEGGHFIPDADVRRRYHKSIANLPKALRVADMAKVYDNSGDQHRLVLSTRQGTTTYVAALLPSWVSMKGR
jgi:predicted ABC-type ATPase